ncbi:putative triglyceride lipase [Actinidia rufa]|uniref:Putative triglyceride lipase n=1 Tax=Actinidia rufa TaxID=165716 RepID=A0A7J0G3Q6_9ERIC|nr:putative triglyceride lipase [Actinidia rufa]
MYHHRRRIIPDCSINERSCVEDGNLLNRNGGTGNEQTSLSLTQVELAYSQRIAEAGYIESGLASPEGQDTFDCDVTNEALPNKEFASPLDGSELDEKKAEEMRALFSTAESAMEAWAMLATSLGHPSFIKSEFEKLCFLDNPYTDTQDHCFYGSLKCRKLQVAIWRDSARKRLVVAFRGTEQTRWKDLRNDLMLVPAGLNPERIGGDFKQEVQVHSGFLSAYDSVRTRILSLIKLAVEYL